MAGPVDYDLRMEFKDRRPPQHLAMVEEAARRHHARHFGVDPDFVTRVTPPLHRADWNEGWEEQIRDPDATHLISFTHPDPATFNMRRTSWKVYANDPERPPVPPRSPFAYNTGD